MNKTFYDLYKEEKKKPTAAQQFIADVAALTKKSEATIRMWLAGRQQPDYADRLLISIKYDVSAESLFPNPEKQSSNEKASI